VGIFNPRDCKKDSQPKLRIFLETSGNSKQTTINGEVSYRVVSADIIVDTLKIKIYLIDDQTPVLEFLSVHRGWKKNIKTSFE